MKMRHVLKKCSSILLSFYSLITFQCLLFDFFKDCPLFPLQLLAHSKSMKIPPDKYLVLRNGYDYNSSGEQRLSALAATLPQLLQTNFAF